MKVALISFINKGSFSSLKHVCANLRKSREPVAWVLGKRNEKTVRALRDKIGQFIDG
ncbi:MAG: hypothetical protein GDA51_08465 [Ekhidna sp.]|nr:hypothetical protein [Ekhidna sp.]